MSTMNVVTSASPETSVISYQTNRLHIRDGSDFRFGKTCSVLVSTLQRNADNDGKTTMIVAHLVFTLLICLRVLRHIFCNSCLCTSQVWFKLVPDECNTNTDTWLQELRVPMEIKRMECVYLFSSFGLVRPASRCMLPVIRAQDPVGCLVP
jgi:hypothetical protein